MEDYKKMYEDALAKIKQIFDKGSKFVVRREVFESIFPELKESEDERIKKNIKIALMSMEDNLADFYSTHRTSQKELLTWLEKQGEQHPKFRIGDTIKKKSTGDIVIISEVDLENREYGLSNTGFIPFKYEHLWELVDDKVELKFHVGKYYTCIKDCSFNKEYHKGGVYKAVVNRIGKISLTSDKDYVFPIKNESVFNEYFRLATNEEIEEISGNKGKISSNESKFKKGEWVVYDGWTTQIIEVYEDGYTNDRQGFIPKVREDSMKKWTIQDAKDGDVLADGNLPFIFKKIDANKYSYAYCGISVDDDFKIESDGESGEWTWTQDIKPATKEQRDLLFSKMKEAGYEWNAEHKQLKKIEDESAWSEEDEKNLALVFALIETLEDVAQSKNTYSDVKLWLKSLKNRL